LLSVILMTRTSVVVNAIKEEKRQEEERANRIMITTGAVFQEHYISSNRKRNKISVTEAEGLMMSVKQEEEGM
jgi:hypothetical protein